MNSDSTTPADEPHLRTLSPALRQLEQHARTWLGGPHRFPLHPATRAALEGEADDLRRQAEALDVDRPLLVVLLMGGTGVGKSTLLNALAGGAVAQASFVRPTTRDPVVYYHESLRPEKLDPALRHCRLVAHDRPALQHKILVDTPDLDSNDLSNREKLFQMLPVADVVLYVGSQEKYHDNLGWELFRQQRQRRAFAFVLNKWDRCLHGTGGIRPDEDLLRDLRAEGFHNPLLFRTCAQRWVDNPNAPTLPEGEQFRDLVHWLEAGLMQLEIEAIKSRGVSQLLAHLAESLEEASPPDLTEIAVRTRAAWERLLDDEAGGTAQVLLNAIDPYQREIEHHFALEGQRRFHGLMAGYLHLFTRLRYVGSTLRARVPFLPRFGGDEEKPAAAWDLAAFTRLCSSLAADRHLDARGKALANRLLVAAKEQGYALELLTERTESAALLDWRQRNARLLAEVLHQVESEWTKPAGAKRWVQTAIIWLADWAPPLALLAACTRLLWNWFMVEGYQLHATDILVPLVVLLLVLIILHLLVVLLLPVRWPAIRGEFRRRLEQKLRTEMEGVYAAIPEDIAAELRQEREHVEQLQNEVREVAAWLEQGERAASVAGLYGH